ncbi:hypothetical protein [Corallococcus carmarthensis]|uniref:hypothetical protein n=1 Tax=Corallococcus carmarthensis TaxID=2316728 RepID=UPI0011C468D2|nr:hypothetical protein [Corallococcus carmarthensis]
MTAENPKPKIETVPGPTSLSKDGGAPSPPDEVSLVSLDELAPTPPSPIPSTALVRSREQPTGGVRERTGDVSVVSHCEKQSCMDGLQDLRTKRELIALAPTRDERATLDGQGSVQRVVKIAHTSDGFVSVYTGSTNISDGAKANNSLSCATYGRGTGRPLNLKDAVPPKEALALTHRAEMMLEAFQRKHGLPAYRLTPKGFLHDASSGRVALCAEAPTPMAGTVIVIWLQQ